MSDSEPTDRDTPPNPMTSGNLKVARMPVPPGPAARRRPARDSDLESYHAMSDWAAAATDRDGYPAVHHDDGGPGRLES
jgi:hypothetical protein